MACSKSSLEPESQLTVTGRVSKADLNNHLKGSRVPFCKYLFRETNASDLECTVPTICDKHLTKGGCQEDGKCQRLHICPYFAVGGECGQNCEFGHDFLTHHNSKRLRIRLTANEGITHLLQFAYKHCRPQNTFPRSCDYYNQAKGCTNKRCRYLHVCDHYIKQHCKFGSKCKRSHDIYDVQPKTILKKYNIDTDRSPKETLLQLRRLLGIDQEIETKSGTRRTSAARQNSSATDEDLEICSYFLNGSCSFGDHCRNLHDATKYRWQYTEDPSSGNWTSFTGGDNDGLENAFRDPQCDRHRVTLSIGAPKVPAHVDFVSMMLTAGPIGPYRVRRLSTTAILKAPSSKSKVATTWGWYWKDVDGKFIMYGQKGFTNTSQTSSDDIEKEFLANPTSVMEFQTDQHQYKLDFTTMIQRNITYETEREVRRRPIDVPTSDADNLRFQALSTKSIVPKHWTDIESDADFKRVLIGPSGKTEQEYKEIEQLFLQTMSHTKVTKIERIQNPDLWEKYSLKKNQMDKKSDANEKRLFHGTSGFAMDGICEQGFDWRLKGSRVGTLYGDGSYFHKDASYSMSYSDCNAMFLAKVLVGRYTNGASGMKRPPPISPSDPHKLYDAVVDDESDPKIHVVFNHDQSYPEYIITYN